MAKDVSPAVPSANLARAGLPAGRPRILIGVVAHVEREKQAMDLAHQTGAAVVALDDGQLGCFGNHLRTWRALLHRAQADEWLVVLEDDAVPVVGFLSQLTRALDATPRRIVSLYLGRDRPRASQPHIRALVARGMDGAHWVDCQWLLHAVGVAMHARLARQVISDLSREAYVFLPIDQAVSRWAMDNGHRVAYTWPSLVDHADGDPVEYGGDPLRGPVGVMDDGRLRLQRRVAWRTGARTWWGPAMTTLHMKAPTK